MKYLLIPPTALQGTVVLPTSKSISNRVLIINALAESDMPIEGVSDCDDTRVMLNVLQSNDTKFDVGAAGTSMRFLTAFLSKIVGKWEITGSERMKNRPIKLLVDALNELGAKIEYIEKEGYPPLRIYGSALQGGRIEMQGNVSSQYISALLMLAPTMQQGLRLVLQGDIISVPYIQMTIKIMEQFGIQSYWKDNEIYIPNQAYTPVPFVVEGDWSAASYWYEMLALAPQGEVELKGLYKDSVQGDAAIATIFEHIGVKTKFTKQGVILSKKAPKKGKLVYNFVNQPDLAQTCVVCCCLLGIPFYFSGLQSLKIKETDRIYALVTELKKLGYVVHQKDNSILEFNNERCDVATEQSIDTYDDHRMAMAFAPACIKVGEISINEPHVVTKSYPNFWVDLQSLGFTLHQM
ncbi:MAG: 3-phosphoshikimate 1-carboxyvinyltransferase [Paludibacteraceae bacterium]|nr:3-phosphoshikimate 1-carboxyvinyltransferase [Paludibacteraceae bacterium]MBP7218887.1 3-phosphoshikimate 1-carboxyvinyltransferase [Paludibacteraceae bacterium]MBP8627543.1 3-phosphoshikimate 1-carboxyvinyltransferase [Paludibacteraceae bacterium]MBP8782151.1 3-phosphoshikimate 1-carboxyvinyltransferase [Paludibacteraceae bacterium]MBP9648313.1 3-phosphoshikimate 1-carboxyvinyltransferase [Paludibacteraceae bacterium]